MIPSASTMAATGSAISSQRQIRVELKFIE
jgi:hypothetical protein